MLLFINPKKLCEIINLYIYTQIFQEDIFYERFDKKQKK